MNISQRTCTTISSGINTYVLFLNDLSATTGLSFSLALVTKMLYLAVCKCITYMASLMCVYLYDNLDVCVVLLCFMYYII